MAPEAERCADGGRFELEILRDLGWERVFSGSDWNLLWYYSINPGSGAYQQLDARQRINHIPGIEALGNKADLYRNLNALKHRMGNQVGDDQLNFFSKTYMLPEQWRFFAVNATRQTDKYWLLKLVLGTWGRDIGIAPM